MAQELQKQVNGTLETARRLYAAAKATSVAKLLYLMGQQYSLEITPELTALWQESLAELSPNQVRDGFMNYLKSENAHFKPAPGDIIANADEAKDRPRKIKSPDCPDCHGTGYRMIKVDSVVRPGWKTNRATDCYCVSVEYDGQSYADASRQLVAAPEKDPREVLAEIAEKLPDVTKAAKPMPGKRQMTDEELARRRQEMINDFQRKVKP